MAFFFLFKRAKLDASAARCICVEQNVYKTKYTSLRHEDTKMADDEEERDVGQAENCLGA